MSDGLGVAHLQGRTHGIGGVHAPTSARTRAGMPDNIKSFLIADLADGKST